MSHQRGYGRVLDGEQRARIHTLIIVGRGLAAPKLASGAEHSSVSLDELLRVSEPICTLKTNHAPRICASESAASPSSLQVSISWSREPWKARTFARQRWDFSSFLVVFWPTRR